MGYAIKLDGYDELLAEVDRIEKELSVGILQDVVQAGGEVLATAAKAECPRNPLDDAQIPLWAAIYVKTVDYGIRSMAIVGPSWEYAKHGHLVEFGHEIIARGEGKTKGKDRTKGGSKSGGQSLGRAKPNAFMRRAFDGNQPAINAAMEAVVASKVRELGGT
jgi:HK97 gp10 family phage protein